MAEAEEGERTEEPTQTRREEFRKRGQVAQTKELATALILGATFIFIWLMGRYFFQQVFDLFSYFLNGGLRDHIVAEGWRAPMIFAATQTAKLAGPILGVFWIVSFASTFLQIGFLTNDEALQVKWDRLNPVQGFSKLFSMQNLAEGIKSVLKLVAVGCAVYVISKSEVHIIPTASQMSVAQILALIGQLTFKLIGGLLMIMLSLAGLDFMFQRWDLEKKMRMTKQEIKEEHKSREGDPMIKARIRRIQREVAQRRMMEEVPKADVIITNPTHLAVAIKYDETMISPKVIAKGADLIAEKIRELAKKHSIPIVENKPLARTIFKTIEVGQSIPRELYMAVAEVLSYVYKIKGKRKA